MSSDNQLFGRGNLFLYISFVLISGIINHSRILFWQLSCYIRFRLRWIPKCSFNFFIKTNECAPLFFSLHSVSIVGILLKIILVRYIYLGVFVIYLALCSLYYILQAIIQVSRMHYFCVSYVY